MFSLVYLCESTCPHALDSRLSLITQARYFTSSWELVTSLDYEWDVIRGRRPYRRTIWVRNVFGLRHYPPTEQKIKCYLL
jgi:hypothetical protein